jgi:hypothetical protein
MDLVQKIRSDLNEWSPHLYELFFYFDKKLDVLFEKTEHCSYFEKLPFGKKMKFEKMSNTTIPLVILT